MPRLVAFLRAVNVGGRTATMDQLRTAFRALGFEDVETFIASGNVIFRSRSSGIPSLQRKIEARLRDVLGYEVTTFLRTDAQVAAIARYRPFPPAELRTAVALNVGFTAEPLGPTGRKTLLALRTEIDDFHVHGAEVYWLCKRKQSESTFCFRPVVMPPWTRPERNVSPSAGRNPGRRGG